MRFSFFTDLFGARALFDETRTSRFALLINNRLHGGGNK